MKLGFDTWIILGWFLVFNAFLIYQVDGVLPKLALAGWFSCILIGAAVFYKLERKQ